ncbi:hypothetical protein ACQ4PT_036991 [Festuca glaucescens]
MIKSLVDDMFLFKDEDEDDIEWECYARLVENRWFCLNYMVENLDEGPHCQVGKGLSKNGKAQKLALQHCLEAIDPTIRGIDMGTICISIMMLDIGEGKEINLEKCPRSKLQNQCIKYLGPQERQQYEVVVESGKLVFKQTGVLVHSSDDFKWIFVLSTTKAFYVGQKNKGSFQHSSFLAGGAITAAGRLVDKDGILKAIWPYNGHYLPTEENFGDFVRYLQENGVDLTDVKLLSKLDTQPEQNQNNKAGAGAATVAEDLNKIALEDVRTSDTDHGTTDYGDMSEAKEDVATPADSYTTDTEEEELNDVSEQSPSTVADRSENHLVVDGSRPRHSVRAGLPAGSPVQGPRARQPLAETHGLAVEEEGPGALAAPQPAQG